MRLWSDVPMQVDVGNYDHVTPWDDIAWRSTVLEWIGARLGRPVDPETIDVRVRPWSVVIRIPDADRGPVWFKANPPMSAFEPRLAAALAEWAPGHTLVPIATEPDLAWSLLPDGGELLTDPSPPSWSALLSQYADLQRSVSSHTDDLLALGVPDLRPEILVDRFDQYVAEVAGAERIDEVAKLRPQVVDWSQELAAGSIGVGLDHSDLHARQIFGPTDGRYTFFDWGDASVGHPFTSLLVPLRNMRRELGDAAVEAARDAYLDRWPGDPAELRRIAHVACRLGPISRAMVWMRVFSDDRDSVLDYVGGWLTVLLDEPPI
jgi:hypothetical protein